MRKCRFCSAEIEDASRVCEHCGRDLIVAPAPSRPADYGKALPVAPDPDVSTAPIVRVTVVDLDLPFGSMIGFMVKWALASIPAFLILFFFFVFVVTVFGGLFASCKIPGAVPR
jgi:hypothetical protein